MWSKNLYLDQILCANTFFNLCLCKARVKYNKCVFVLTEEKVWIYMIHIGKVIKESATNLTFIVPIVLLHKDILNSGKVKCWKREIIKILKKKLTDEKNL